MEESKLALAIYGILGQYFPEYNEDTTTLQYVVMDILKLQTRSKIVECVSPDGRLLIAIFKDGTSRALTKEEWFIISNDIEEVWEFRKR
jgi:hypothetical protein